MIWLMGLVLKKANLPKVIDFANHYLRDIEFDIDEVEVDYIFHNGNINLSNVI